MVMLFQLMVEHDHETFWLFQFFQGCSSLGANSPWQTVPLCQANSVDRCGASLPLSSSWHTSSVLHSVPRVEGECTLYKSNLKATSHQHLFLCSPLPLDQRSSTVELNSMRHRWDGTHAGPRSPEYQGLDPVTTGRSLLAFTWVLGI